MNHERSSSFRIRVRGASRMPYPALSLSSLSLCALAEMFLLRWVLARRRRSEMADGVSGRRRRRCERAYIGGFIF